MLKMDGSGEALADLANWRTAPYCHLAFHDIARFMTTAVIRDAGGGKNFSVADEQAGLVDSDFLAASATDGLLVLSGGRIVFEQYANGMGPDDPHILMSASKAVTGLLAGALVDRGVISMNGSVADHVPELADTPYAGVTLRDLLDMRVNPAFLAGAAEDYADACNWDPPRPGRSDYGLHQFLSGLRGPAADAGGPFRYVSANIDLLGWVFERASGRPVAELAEDLLLSRIGARGGALVTVDRKGAPRCTGGFCLTLRDFARLGQLVVDRGRAGDTQVVSPDWIGDLLAGGDRQAWAQGEWSQVFTRVSREMSCRSGWYVTHDRPGTLFAMGIHGQNLFVDAHADTVIAKLSSQPAPFDYPLVMATHRDVARVRAVLAAAA